MKKVKSNLLFTIIVLIAFSCKGNKNVESDSNRISGLEVDSIKVDSMATTEKPVLFDVENWDIIVPDGKYFNRSIDKELIGLAEDEIPNQILNDTALLNDSHCAYLANDEPIALFKRFYPKGKEDIAGVLKSSSLIYIDTIFLNEENPDDAWYAIRINGRRYYTDYAPHEYIDYKTYIPSKEQILILFAQETDQRCSYPDFFEFLVFEKPEANETAWKQVYRSTKMHLYTEEHAYERPYDESSYTIEGDNVKMSVLYYPWWLIWNGNSISLEPKNK